MAQHVIVTDYDPAWPLMYQEEKALIRRILGDDAVAVYHIGSTSVPGLAAKPVIDIMVAVKSLAAADEASGLFAAAGYEWMGEYGIPGRRYLRKGGDERTHQIHIFQADDSGSIIRHLAFRSYLEAHAGVRDEYARLKKELAARHPYDIDGYCDGKDGFVRGIEADAVRDYDASWDELFISAAMIRGERKLSRFAEAGSVSAAILTESGNIYRGVCIDAACSLGMCAERSAAAAMIAGGESSIRRIAIVMADGGSGLPCGACKELLMQLSPDGGIEILLDYETKRTALLTDLAGPWWGRDL